MYGVLDQAVNAGLLVSCAPRMAFAHDLVREALLRDLPALRRAAAHREVMAALADRPGVDVAVVAHHAVEAGPAAYGEAARWARAAARQASLRLAYEEAALWWGRAVAAHGASAGDPSTTSTSCFTRFARCWRPETRSGPARRGHRPSASPTAATAPADGTTPC
nr:hypothetical protein GCM10020093_032200 [Planobispora longispora]